MKITGSVRIEKGGNSEGDEKRFIISEVTERVIIPRDLKERRAKLIAELADIEESLLKLKDAKE